MIRLGDRNTSRGISSPRTGTARGRGLNAENQSSAHFSSREKYFLLTFPLIEPQGRQFSSGPPKLSEVSPLYSCCNTAMLQVSDFHSRRARGLWKSRACSSRTFGVSLNRTQASCCYECHPLTSGCPLTKFRAAGCALFQNESSDVVWSRQQTFLYRFRGPKLPAESSVRNRRLLR